MMVRKHISALAYECGGEEHEGWLPPGAAKPLPTPVRRLTLDLRIEGDDSGYLLIVQAQEDPAFSNDWWFATLVEAEATAEERFGITPSQWRNG